MKKDYLISIVMPMYNQEDYIKECLESVMHQSLKNIEIIVVNDGSTDTSLKIVKDLAKTDDRIVIVDKPNSGYGNSVNIGISKASGKYIGIVETDDFISEHMFETLYELSEDGTVDVIKGNFYDFYENSEGEREYVVNTERQNVPVLDHSFTIKTRPEILWGHPSVWSAIYRSDFLKQHNIVFKEEKGGGWVDNPFFFETLCNAEKVVWTDEPLYYYRKTNMNSSSNGVVNPNLPFDRMHDNLDVVEAAGFNDEVTKRYLYSRALMYANGALKECGYDKNKALIDQKAQNLMRRLDIDIFKQYFNDQDIYTYTKFASPINTICNSFPKILIYNWLPYDNPWNMGGGVTLYCKNIINSILKEYPFATIYFLSSGFSYDAQRKDTYIRQIGSVLGDRCLQYEIVNSPVPAAIDNLFVNPTVALKNPELKSIFKSFMDKMGPFKVVHFNNIEGISLDVLDLKQDFLDTKFIFSIHNYAPFCLTGFYFQRHNHCNCNPNHTGLDCMKCTRKAIKRNIARETYNRGLYNTIPEECYSEKFWTATFNMERLDQDVSVDHILDFAKTATATINKNCDKILAVSKRVRDIAIENGMDADKTIVSYIGTVVANRQIGKSIASSGAGLKIVFLGNSIGYEEKGYPFLLKALSKLDAKYASRIELVLTVREKQHKEIYEYCKLFKSVKVINGYTHQDLPAIFEGCNLSLVPVLWEDNLPQIAIESVAYGVPVLASSAGGASELCSSELFRFEAGNTEDLLNKIKHFVDHPCDILTYWDHHNGLTTMSMHVKELLEVYGLQESPTTIQISKEDFSYLLMEREASMKLISVKSHSQPVATKTDEELELERIARKVKKILPKGSFRRKLVKKVFGKAGGKKG